jgi:hypothetical protein
MTLSHGTQPASALSEGTPTIIAKMGAIAGHFGPTPKVSAFPFCEIFFRMSTS